ncbi:unnamed protein product [Phytophthora lilii]|uniref:Unnamed protein product n=1 Tax=Phytophthora lilii TaxID=2077276 RepID=A0A9W6WT85_9STRA|nr:unnamed protein product [Phytophthora lilii]
MPTATFDVATRKVPALALVPRGLMQHATRAKKKVAGSIQEKKLGHLKHDGGGRTEDDAEGRAPSPPHPARRRPLGDALEEEAEEQSTREPSPGRHKDQPHQIKEEEDESGDDDDGQVELRLGERFLNMMALMARLLTQSLGDNPAPSSPGSPSRLARTNTERSLGLVRSSTERTLASVPPTIASPPPPPQQQSPKLQQVQATSPPKSPKHAVREVSKRLPPALQGPLTFDICMLLPAPLDDRQTPLRSPIRRKWLRKRVRRRRLRRRARRTWHASHASWPPHASADYIVDHSRQDVAGISAARLVERLGERKVSTHTLPRVLSMPLPPLHRINKHALGYKSTGGEAEDKDEEFSASDNEQESENESVDDDDDKEEKEEKVDDENSSQDKENKVSDQLV